MSLLKSETLLGKTEEEARKICENYGHQLRVISTNGIAFSVTTDYRTNRINVSVTNGNISCINGVG